MELETAARKHALAQTPITNITGQRVYKNRSYFTDNTGSEVPLEGSGLSFLVFRRAGGWTKPIRKSSEYPILVADCISDHVRDPEGRPIVLNAEERALQLYRELDRVFHRPEGVHDFWPDSDPSGLYIEGSLRGSEPAGPVWRDGVAIVRVTYDVKVFH